MEEFNQENQTYTYNSMQGPSKKKSHLGAKIAAVALSCTLIGGMCGAGGVFLGMRLADKSEPVSIESSVAPVQEALPSPATNSVATTDTNGLLTPAQVYAANVNSTVGITTEITTNYWGYTTTSPASGSGIVYSSDGYIITNYHVVEEGKNIKAAFYDGSTYPATVVGYDESNDLAVLKIDATNLTPVTIGDSDALNVGDEVIAIGNPLGELTFSLTDGVVSALDREISLSNNVKMKLIQTDCAINSGNSGGALFNMKGELVGITNAKYSSSGYSSASIDNIAFAIPISNVKGIVDGIIEKGYFAKPYIGVSVVTVGEDIQAYGVPAGASVKEIVESSPAAIAGLQVSDVITEANGEAIDTSGKLVEVVRATNIGDRLELKVYRAGEYVDITVIVGESNQSAIPKRN